MPVNVPRGGRDHLQTTDWSLDVSTTKGKSYYTCVNKEKQQICSTQYFLLGFSALHVSQLTLSTRFKSNQPVNTLIKTN